VPEPQSDEETLGGEPAQTDPETKLPNPEEETEEPGKPPVNAKSASEQLAENVLEDLTGVQAKWLGGIKPEFQRLTALALSSKVSDAEFLHAVETSQRHFPELFKKLDTATLQSAMEKAMGTALVNGVAKGVMARGAGKKGRA
jgi:hypothetical protein